MKPSPNTPFLFRPLCFVAIFLGMLTAHSQPVPTPTPAPVPVTEDGVNVTLPNNSIQEVLSLYEMLTGKRLIRDANLAGPPLTIVVPDKIPREDAIKIIESSLLLNGYSLVPVDANTVKILGQAKSPFGESVPLYADPASLPDRDQMVSYFMLLKYISTKDALTVFDGYVARGPVSRIVAVPNSNAIVISDNTPVIRRLIALQRLIDVPGSKILTEFIPLTRADAEKVAETINDLLESEKEKESNGAPAQSQQPQQQQQQQANVPGQPPQPAQPVSSGGGETMTQINSTVQIVADARTNRILVVAPESRMPYLRKLIAGLDVAVSLEDPLEKVLQFVSASDVLPVLQNILAEGSDKDEQGNTSQSGQSSQSSLQSPGGGQEGMFAGGGGGEGSKPDMLREPEEKTQPLAVSVGKVRIIANPSSNKIIVIGPPESKNKAATVIAMLDQRPKRVYLATIIGQLTLTDGLEVGFDYLMKFTNFNPDGPTSGFGGLLRSRTDLLPDPSSLATNTAFPLLSGLTVYGTIAETVDVYAKALMTNSDFKVLSRPVVFTVNNKKAVISSGQQVPVPTQSLSSATTIDPNNPTNTGTSIQSNIDYKPVVLKLEVIPLINSPEEVTLTIAQQNDNILERVVVSNNEVPVIGTQELRTTVTVRNRQTIILGGLITEEDRKSKSGIPLLSSVPGVGYLFSTTKKDKVRRELIILIQPLIINSESDVAEAQYIERSMSAMKDELYDERIPVRPAEGIDMNLRKKQNWSLFPKKSGQ